MTDPTREAELEAEAIRLCEQALSSPASGSVVWNAEALARTREQAAYLARSILALRRAPSDGEAANALGAWMSAALDDPAVCDAMKADIRAWFEAGQPVPTITTDGPRRKPVKMLVDTDWLRRQQDKPDLYSEPPTRSEPLTDDPLPSGDWVFGEREKPWRVMTVEEFSALPVRSGVIRAEFNYDGFGGVGVWLCGESDTPQDRTPPELKAVLGEAQG